MKFSVFFVILENNKFCVIIGQNIDHPLKMGVPNVSKTYLYILSGKEDKYRLTIGWSI
jgi:hypothetical protein